MRIFSEKGEFELSVGLVLEVTKFNPAFNDAGEQSFPLTLPPTRGNMAKLGFPDRLDSLYKPVSELNVNVQDGIFIRTGRMIVHAASYTDGISCTIYFGDGDFFAMIGEKNMQDVQLDVIDGVGDTLEDKVQDLINILKTEYLNQNSQKFSVIPIQTAHKITRDLIYVHETGEETSYSEEINLVLNGFETNYSHRQDAVDGVIFLSKFMGESPQRHIDGNTTIEIGKGYGMTAFVDLFYFIQKMCDYLGYSFNDAELRVVFTDPVVPAKSCILNNVADAIYEGKLDLSQLVPNITLKQFIKYIADYSGGVFFVDEFEKALIFRTYIDVFQYNPKMDLTRYLNSPLKVESVEFSKIEMINASSDSLRKEDRSYIEFNFSAQSDYSFKYLNMESETRLDNEIILSLLSLNNIIHLNSSVIKNTEIDTEKTKDSSKELILVGIEIGAKKSYFRPWRGVRDETYEYYAQNDSMYVGLYPVWKYNQMYMVPKTNIPYLSYLYQQYIEWKRNSNMIVSCEMKLPPEILHNLDFSKQYIIQGQPYFIDRIKYKLPFDGRHEVALRTYRTYQDRDDAV